MNDITKFVVTFKPIDFLMSSLHEMSTWRCFAYLIKGACHFRTRSDTLCETCPNVKSEHPSDRLWSSDIRSKWLPSHSDGDMEWFSPQSRFATYAWNDSHHGDVRLEFGKPVKIKSAACGGYGDRTYSGMMERTTDGQFQRQVESGDGSGRRV